MSDKINSWT